jgi:cysteinyl-tRNA synthetase
MNITDIDDKTIKATTARYGNTATVADLRQVTDEYFQKFYADLVAVNVSVDQIRFIKVTDCIPAITTFITKLIDQGFAYQAEDGSTYFSIEKYQARFHDYGALVGETFLEGKKIGARVAVDEYDKDNLSDFALWKKHVAADGNIFWDDPVLGKGRPGWHIECSAINWEAFAGKTTTIHTGGIDLKFPHHTNEIAQSTPLYAPEQFVKVWCHSEHLLVENKKMSKSLGNFYTLRDLEERGFSGLDYRYFLLNAHYRTQQNFTWEALTGAQKARQRLYEKIATLLTNNKNSTSESNFGTSILPHVAHDLAFSQALADLLTFLSNSSSLAPEELQKIDLILGLKIAENVTRKKDTPTEMSVPATVELLLTARSAARAAKNWSESDRLRQEIERLGYTVEDLTNGPHLKKMA